MLAKWGWGVTVLEEDLVTLEDVYFSYKNSPRQVLQGINLVIRQGDMIGLLGESGSGKTTLSLVLAGFEQPGSGRVLYKKADLRQRRVYQEYRSVIQYLFQNPRAAVNRFMRVFDLVAEPLVYRKYEQKIRVKLVAETLNMVGLEETRWYDYPDQLSLGQLQRICLARAMITRPLMIICDEPFSALDVISRVRMENVIFELNEKNSTTFVIISHEPKTLLKLCQKIMVLQDGRQTDFWRCDQNNILSQYARQLLPETTKDFKNICV
jgi:nickel transport system ATP-binding protein